VPVPVPVDSRSTLRRPTNAPGSHGNDRHTSRVLVWTSALLVRSNE
jgi:hypothetical protein